MSSLKEKIQCATELRTFCTDTGDQLTGGIKFDIRHGINPLYINPESSHGLVFDTLNACLHAKVIKLLAEYRKELVKIINEPITDEKEETDDTP